MSGRYMLGPELGRGAIGRVVEVTDLETGASLAGKVLHESNRDDASAATRFAREAEITGDLAHDNIARVHGVIEVDGEKVLLMEKIEGPSLVRVLAESGPLPESRIIAIGRGIASGLAAAHRAGVVHRDLKPANVLLLPGDVPKIVDFGMARATSFDGVDRKSFAIVGTPDYMAPECVDPLTVDPRSDLYALGCILFELATGAPPFSGATAFALMEAHQRDPVPDVPGVSPGLAALIKSLLAKSPADRPQSAAAVAQSLHSAVALTPVRATTAVARAGSCVHCGAALVTGVDVCFGCGRAPIVLEAGSSSVVVKGPGGIAHKLDTGLRGKLLAWLRANPQIGLDPEPLAKNVPRLPFIVAQDLSSASAKRLVEALNALGLDAAAAEGGAYSHPDLRQKAFRIAGRRALIGLGMLGPIMQAAAKAPFMLPLMLAIPVAFGIHGFFQAAKRVALPGRALASPLPRLLGDGLNRVVEVVPAIEARRHREGLRAVVQRLLALREALPAGERTRLDDDLVRILDLATAASVRVDELERRLASTELRDASRAELRERDAWAARLLDASAQLDALRARWAAAQARGTAAEIDQALAELRAEVEAFEEVQRL